MNKNFKTVQALVETFDGEMSPEEGPFHRNGKNFDHEVKFQSGDALDSFIGIAEATGFQVQLESEVDPDTGKCRAWVSIS